MVDVGQARTGAGQVRLDGTRTSDGWAQLPGNWDRLNCRAIYPSSNRWGVPDLPATDWVPDELVAYNSRSEIAAAGGNAAVHFFLDDYRFETVWTKPVRPLSRIQRVGGALTPDFSLWRDMPLSMQLWQVYRARWCGLWMAAHGVRVIPTVGWSTSRSFPFAFLGIARGSVVACSTVGVVGMQAAELFVAGYREMVARLSPSLVLLYGNGRLGPAQDVLGLAPVKVFATRWG